MRGLSATSTTRGDKARPVLSQRLMSPQLRQPCDALAAPAGQPVIPASPAVCSRTAQCAIVWMGSQVLVATRRMIQGERPMGGMHLVHANILSPQDLLLILLIALLFFGGKKLPEIGSSLGQAMREFRRTAEEEDQPAPRERPQAAPGGATPRALGTPAPSSPPAAEA